MGVTSMESAAASLRVLFEAGTLAGLGDDRLLDMYRAGERDEAERAFAVLVERHGPMVLGICEAVLRNRQEAEDAFQAVFLVLAQRSGTIRRGTAVANWLYGVARRVSLRSRRSLARRRMLEERRVAAIGTRDQGGEAAAVSPPTPYPELYEEVDRLPEAFRAAVVLCDLEGASYDAAATQLGCPVGTLQSRLARGRQRLRERLVRRGFGPEFLALGFPMARAVPPSLARQVAHAAGAVVARGSASGLAPDVAVGLAVAEVRRAVAGRILGAVALLGMAASVGLAALLVGRGDERAVAREEKQVVVIPPAPAEIERVYIRVLDERDKEVPGQVLSAFSEIDDYRALWSYTTDAEGWLVIPKQTIQPSQVLAHRGNRALLGANAGDGLIHEQQSRRGTRDNPYVLRFQPLTHAVEGTVVDSRGRPIPGVRVVAQSGELTRDEALVMSQSVYNVRATTFRLSFFGDLRIPGLPGAFTDEAGRYRILLPAGATISMRPYHDRYFGREAEAQPESTTLKPFVMEPAGSIVGRIVDSKTGRPVPNARVVARIQENRGHQYPGLWGGQADGEGRFGVLGLPPGVYVLCLSGTPDRQDVSARAAEGLRVHAGRSTSAQLEVVPLRPLRGMVVDRATGEPVAGVTVRLNGPQNPRIGGALDSRITDPRGGFEFRTIPGTQYLDIPGPRMAFGAWGEAAVVVPEQGDIGAVRLVRALADWARRDSAVNDRTLEAAVEQTPSPSKAPVAGRRTLTGHVRDPSGKPLAGVSVYPKGIEFELNAITDRDGTFILENIPSDRRELLLSFPRSRSQKVLAPTDRDEMDIVLEPRPE
ncbi:ECF RNA polymerase sigma factor SigE [Aquisphaera giovannonii]|uniref:ECF RNA polymerase sigma factor SigE n=1 Tax=Aquisphaera giovannonii TaxID=406548 RepID=A0A5B9WE54_9BACT|nr:sigma-70 family RNA polymerase sigma factor [Aquisphaera giovannonii]QEH38251.1 ECF RNA polymerase sigma factor SigE [Aquisphaera giovannonii]